ncbi:MAG TPA: hypothetical protein VF669_23510 [Tepidisphaeraceae bacterium]|jgi:nicotinate phosphoribosyltransferase
MLTSNAWSLALLTDLYQITMAYGYFKSGLADREGCFHLTFRKSPFGSGYSVAAGLGYVIEFLRDLRFCDDDLQYLASLRANDQQPLFDRPFLDFLKNMRFTVDVHAIPEGTVVFPNEPLLRVSGPLLQCQLIETPLLNMINFQTLIATKSARICQAAQGEPVMSLDCAGRRGLMGRWRRAAPATSAGAWAHPTCWRASSFTSRSWARTRTAGS